jgi:hypothetical protein
MRALNQVPYNQHLLASEILANSEKVLGQKTEVYPVKNGFRAVRKELSGNSIIATSKVYKTEDEALANLY